MRVKFVGRLKSVAVKNNEYVSIRKSLNLDFKSSQLVAETDSSSTSITMSAPLQDCITTKIETILNKLTIQTPILSADLMLYSIIAVLYVHIGALSAQHGIILRLYLPADVTDAVKKIKFMNALCNTNQCSWPLEIKSFVLKTNLNSLPINGDFNLPYV